LKGKCVTRPSNRDLERMSVRFRYARQAQLSGRTGRRQPPQGPRRKAVAIETLRTLVDRVELVPENGELAIVLPGDLAAMLSFASNKKPGTISGTGLSALASQASLVAGARNQ
jgi:hypothetical protein